MIYVFAELRNYRQLVRLRAEALPSVETSLATALGTLSSPPRPAGPGSWIAEAGPEGELEAAPVAGAAWQARTVLAERERELFGFAVLIVSLPAALSDAERAGRAAALLETVEDEAALWVAPDCAALFGDSLALQAAGPLYRAVAPRRPEGRTEAGHARAPHPWTREGLVTRALDLIAPRLNLGESKEVLWVHGPAGAGKTALLRELAARLQHEGSVPALRTRTIFRRRSPLHPFLHSLAPSLLARIVPALRGPELAVWDDVGPLLMWLQDPSRQETREEPIPLPDHILEDFYLGYRLYLLAWIRMAGEHLSPALYFCDGIDGYHPESRRMIARLLDDLLACPGFVPVVTSTAAPEPAELAGLDVHTLFVHPLGKREIRSLARSTFPGLGLPEALARRLRRRSGGRYISVVSYLRYLARTGHIRVAEGGWAWNAGSPGKPGGTAAATSPANAEEPALPANPLSVAWFLIRALKEESHRLLYGLSLAGGLLDRQGFLAFLTQAGFDAAAVSRSLSELTASGLMTDEQDLIPRFPTLRRKLEDLLGREGEALRSRFIEHMSSLWESGTYRHPVLLFSFLARNGHTELALRILPEIIRRKLDECDPAGAAAFCDSRTFEFAVPPTPDQAREVAAVTALGRLRAALLQRDAAAAETAQAEVKRLAASDLPASLRGEVLTERGKFFLSVGNAGSGLEELKKALLLYQENGTADAERAPERGERACYRWLGAAMLAEGRLGEAVEYLALSQRLCYEAHDATGTLWTLVYLGDSLFLGGRFTQCLTVIEDGLISARGLFRREVELFLLFLRARTRFQLGAYEQCALDLQACLATADLYSMDAALPVLRAWLGRTLVHGEGLASGVKLLESLRQTREVLLFLAEGSLFSEGLENASLYIERALAFPPEAAVPAPEGVTWQDGFTPVEGRSFRLARSGGLLHRSLLGMRGYLLGIRGFRDEAIRELRDLTRGQKALDEDPRGAWFNYLYSRVLPEAGSEETDDKVTVLSKSLKTLQERASRIDGPADRSSFLWRNRWNRMIMEEARERKLV